MRVLTVANHLGARGGLERTQLTNCRALADRGHRVDLVFQSAGDFEARWRDFVENAVCIPNTLPRRASPLRSTTGVVGAVRAAVRLRPDVLYVYRYWDLPYAAAVGALSRAPVVFHLCLPPPNSMPAWLRWSLGRVHTTLSVSQDTARRWYPLGLDPAHTQVVTTGIDTDEFAPADEAARVTARQALGLGDGDHLVLYAGRIGREKGVDILVEAFRRAAEGMPSLRLAVVGGPSIGADPADSATYAAELRQGAGDSPVQWFDARPDVRPLFAAADLSVVPSLWPEPLSRAVMEPLACGVPVLASDVGGSAELLVGPLAEFLVPPGDVGALAAAIRTTAPWRARRPTLGAECRAFALEHLSLAREVDLIEAALLHAARID